MRMDMIENAIDPWRLATLATLRRRRGDLAEARQQGTFAPQLDVRTSDDALVVTVDLPGVDDKDLEISLDFNRLVIHGLRRREALGEGERRYGAEALYGTFVRALTLPVAYRSHEISAELRDGVLTILVPLARAARSAKIPIVRR